MLLQTSSNEVLLGRLCHLAAIFATPPGSYFGPPRPGSIKMNRRRGRTSLFNGHLDIKTACEESNMINKKKTLKKFGDRKIRIKQPPLTGYNLCTSAVSQQHVQSATTRLVDMFPSSAVINAEDWLLWGMRWDISHTVIISSVFCTKTETSGTEVTAFDISH